MRLPSRSRHHAHLTFHSGWLFSLSLFAATCAPRGQAEPLTRHQDAALVRHSRRSFEAASAYKELKACKSLSKRFEEQQQRPESAVAATPVALAPHRDRNRAGRFLATRRTPAPPEAAAWSASKDLREDGMLARCSCKCTRRKAAARHPRSEPKGSTRRSTPAASKSAGLPKGPTKTHEDRPGQRCCSRPRQPGDYQPT